jgi:hypothetical protein
MAILEGPAEADRLRRGGASGAPTAVARAQRLGGAMYARFDGASDALVSKASDGVWSFLHVLGAHRWREGFEHDLERGWSRYRGSRCVVCDEPWEGW